MSIYGNSFIYNYNYNYNLGMNNYGNASRGAFDLGGGNPFMRQVQPQAYSLGAPGGQGQPLIYINNNINNGRANNILSHRPIMRPPYRPQYDTSQNNQAMSSLLYSMMGMMSSMFNTLLSSLMGNQQPAYSKGYPSGQNGLQYGNGSGIQFGNGSGISFNGINMGGVNLGYNNGWGGISFDGVNKGGVNIGVNNGWGANGNYPGNIIIINNDFGPQFPPPAKDKKPVAPAYDGGTDGRYWGDPHLEGFDGEKYDVTGVSGKTYSMLSDKNIQYNTTFTSWGKNGATVVSQAGIQVGNDKIYYDRSIAAPTVNGVAMTAAKDINDPKSRVALDDNGWAVWDGSVLRVHTKEYEIDIQKKTHTNGDYLDSNIRINQGGPYQDFVAPHGLLGQTADGIAGQKNTGKDQGKQGGTVIDGTVADYEVSNIWAADSKYNRFGVEIGKKETDKNGNVTRVLDKNGNVLYVRPQVNPAGQTASV
jgi:hypothetical protein